MRFQYFLVIFTSCSRPSPENASFGVLLTKPCPRESDAPERFFQLEVPPSAVVLDKKLGEGAFGEVCKWVFIRGYRRKN